MNLKEAKALAKEKGLKVTGVKDFGDGTKGFFVGSTKVWIRKVDGAACWTYDGAPVREGWSEAYPCHRGYVGEIVAEVVGLQ